MGWKEFLETCILSELFRHCLKKGIIIARFLFLFFILGLAVQPGLFALMSVHRYVCMSWFYASLYASSVCRCHMRCPE